MTTARVLITGFGPFPGVSENVSGRLAERLARSKAISPHHHPLHAELLPTEWEAVSTRGPGLLEDLNPRLVLHFGVNMRARGFRIERSAHNLVAARVDARGALPSHAEIRNRGEPRIDTRLSATRLATHLRKEGLPATASRSAGAYLCNYLYYLSLDWAARRERPCDVCFVHIPPVTAMSERELLRGAELILAFLLAHVEETRDGTVRRPGGRAQATSARAG